MLLILVALAAETTSVTYDCSDNCAQCYGQGLCLQCYKRRVVKGPGGYIRSCSTKHLPESDNCLIYGQKGCVKCKPGWAVVGSGSPLAHCVKGSIQNCQDERVLSGSSSCFACLNSYPSSDRTSCIPASQVKNPIPLCKIGIYNSVDGVVGCFGCVPGYIATYEKCSPTPSVSKGCLNGSSTTSCSLCDFKNGWFDRRSASQRCFRNGDGLMLKKD